MTFGRKHLASSVVLLFLLFHCVSAQSDIKLEIGATLPKKYTRNNSMVTMTAAAQLRPFIEVTIKKVKYLIAYEKETRKIKYLYTMDDDFVTSSGLRTDTEITVLWKDINILGYFQLRAPSGKDGWEPVVGQTSAFEGDFLERVEKAGKLTTTIEGFAKGYN